MSSFKRTEGVQEAPTTVLGILKKIGPGLILAASVVGSGELVATTKTGAQAGFWLLWIIVIGCTIKVFTQVEFGRMALCSGEGTLVQLNQIPGPRKRVNWILWIWLAMMVTTLGQLGGIVHGVGQTLAISLPITGDYNQLLANQDAWEVQVSKFGKENMMSERPDYSTKDDVIWAGILTAGTIVLLVMGRYGLIEKVSIVMVAGFTLITLLCVVGLQFVSGWEIRLVDIEEGFTFRLPPVVEGLTKTPVTTALATFGIIGMAATDLITYSYWCNSKGYAVFTGPRDESPEWEHRAKGWMNVIRWDAFCAMVAYTIPTIAFYLLGAAVLHRQGLDPEGSQFIPALSAIFEPVFGKVGLVLFLAGAFAVLFSTFFVGIAGHARVCADAVRVFRLGAQSEGDREWWVRTFSVVFPIISISMLLLWRYPVALILIAGVMQAVMLPLMGGAALYYRYKRTDKRLAPGKLWDVFLWLSALGLLIAGIWAVYDKLF